MKKKTPSNPLEVPPHYKLDDIDILLPDFSNQVFEKLSQ